MKKLKVLISEEQIQKRVKELGEQINRDYAGKTPVVICMLKGAIVFFSDVVRNLSIPLTMEFVRLSSYKDGKEIIVFSYIDDGKCRCKVDYSLAAAKLFTLR